MKTRLILLAAILLLFFAPQVVQAQYGDFYQSQTGTVADTLRNADTTIFALTPKIVQGNFTYNVLITALRSSGSNSGNVYLEEAFDKAGTIWIPRDTVAFSGSGLKTIEFSGTIKGTFLRVRAITTSSGKWAARHYTLLRRSDE